MTTETTQNQDEIDAIVVEMIEQTIDALNNLESTKEDFQTALEDCSDLFESGDEKDGYAKLQDLIGTLKEFAEFCTSIQQLASCLIPDDSLATYSEHCTKFQTLLSNLLVELEAKNFVETADILRYDLCDHINGFYPLFQNLKHEFEECLKQRHVN